MTNTSIFNSEAYRKGRESYFNNREKYVNPYPTGSKAYNHFERGWIQALKGSPSLTIKKPRRARRLPSV